MRVAQTLSLVAALQLLVGLAQAKGGHALVVRCTPPGADLFVDGHLVGKAPTEAPIDIASGDHSVKVVKLGFVPFIDVISTKGRKTLNLQVELVPVSGVLHLTSNIPSSRVLVDGRYVGDTPVKVEIDVGARAVQVSKGGYKDFFKNISAVAGQEVSLDVHLEELPPEENPYYVKPLPPARWYQKRWVWGVMAAGAAVVAGAVVLAVVTRPGDPLASADVRYVVTGRSGFLSSR